MHTGVGRICYLSCNSTYRLRYWNCRVSAQLLYSLLISCNSTYRLRYWNPLLIREVIFYFHSCNSTYRLRYWNTKIQNLSVSKSEPRCNSTYRLRYWNLVADLAQPLTIILLQQHLPFTVLKRFSHVNSHTTNCCAVATALTVYGIETQACARLSPAIYK